MEEERQVPEVHLDCMFMGDEKEGKTLAFLVARERETRVVLSMVVPRKTTGEWICRRLMAWLREIGLESVDIIVEVRQRTGVDKFDCVMEHWNWAIQSVQGMIRTIRSDIEGRLGVKIDATHSIWPWIAEHEGFLLTRFEVGRDWKTAYERLEGKSAKVQGMAFAAGILRTVREADVHVGGWHLLGCQSDDGGGHRGKSKRRVVDENCSVKTRQGEMGSKQFGDGCGGPMAQKRR